MPIIVPTEIVGIDPGFGQPAAAALDPKTGKLIRVTTWNGDDSVGMEMSARCFAIAAVIARWLAATPGPKVIGIEGPALNVRRFKAVEMMARMRQAIFDTCAQHFPNMVHFEIPPASAKIAATGSGNAQKEQVARAVQQIHRVTLDVALAPRHAKADSIAIAMATLGQWRAKTLATRQT